VLSPVIGFLATVTPKKLASRKLDASTEASGPHDFAVRLSHARQSQLSRPSHPDPRFMTIAHTPLWWDGMAQEVKVICPYDQARPLRHIGTTGKSAKCLSSSYFKRNDASSSLLPLWEYVALCNRLR